MKGLVTLSDLLKGVAPKVVGDPTRKPVNKQAAFIIKPAPWWAKPMPPAPPPTINPQHLRDEIDQLRKALREETVRASEASAKLAEQRKELSRTKRELQAVKAAREAESKKLQEALASLKQACDQNAKLRGYLKL